MGGQELHRQECQVALVISDWRTRALLLGELQSQGVDVRAWPDAVVGIRALMTQGLEPCVIVADVGAGSAVTSEHLRALKEAYPAAGLVLLASAYRGYDLEALAGLADRVISRPFRVGDVVRAVVEALGRV